MGLKPRVQHEGTYHVTSRSIAEETIFRDAGDFTRGVTLLGQVVAEGHCRCHAFCFMRTHWHAIFSVDDDQLEHAVYRLNRRYAIAFNSRYRRRGKVFDPPFSSTLIDSEAYLQQVARYIALNPKHHESWPWSSYPALIGLREPFLFVDPTPIIDAFDGDLRRLRRFVDDGRAEGTNLVLDEPSSEIRRGPSPLVLRGRFRSW
jgi:putative transposase